MVWKCINCNCKSKHIKKLEIANQSVCQYYRVPYKPYQQVCRACLRIYNIMSMSKKIKNHECIFSNESPAQPEYFQLSGEEKIEENIEDTQKTALFNCIKTVINNKLIKPSTLHSGDQVYAQKISLLQPWLKATVQLVINKTIFLISFDDDGEKKLLTNKSLAYINAINTQCPISSRVIALFKDDIKMTNHFYAGIIAEPPTHKNKNRYMIFFDNGYTQYVEQNDIRLVCSESKEINDVHENVRDFIKAYFKAYPIRTMVNFNEAKFVYAELNKKWSAAMVTNLDASLVQLKFLNREGKHIEWMYRGSNRLNLIYDQVNKNIQDLQSSSSIVNVNKTINQPYIELYNAEMDEIDNPNSDNIYTINLPPNIIKPHIYKVHKCNHLCMSWIQYDYSKTKKMNTLSIPLHFGFKRIIIPNENSESDKVIYISPCGFIINNDYEMYNYLKKAKNDNFMTIDFFSFDDCVNPLAIYKDSKCFNYIDDISNNMEFKPISAINCLDHRDPPAMKYITERIIEHDVNVSLDTQFLCSCDCIDNCEDKTKCSCWQLTTECLHKLPQIHKHDNIGYTYKRLNDPVCTGIYECNKNCKCMKTCLNRVVQEPMSSTLQIFLTEKKGWGVKTLVDIPRGSFVCTLIGALHTEREAEIDAKKYGDAYLAELDYIERVEELKEHYESDVDPIDTESDDKNSSSDEEFNPGGQVLKSKNKLKSKMSLRRNVQNTNKRSNRIYQSSKLNTRHRIVTKKKSLRKYYDGGCGIYTLDANVSGNVGRYTNHSCDPNLFVQNVFVDSHDLRFPWIAYFALKYIPAGTELTWDYSYTIGSVKNKQLICHCGSKNCRGRLL